MTGQTFDALDLAGAKPGEGALVLGSRQPGRPNGTLEVGDGCTRRRAPLPRFGGIGHVWSVYIARRGGSAVVKLTTQRRQNSGELWCGVRWSSQLPEVEVITRDCEGGLIFRNKIRMRGMRF